MTRAENAAHWRNVVSELEASGLSGADFCRQRNLNLAQVYRWRRHFSNATPRADNHTGFLELVAPGAVPTGSSSGISIEISGGISIRLACGFDAATLRAVLLAVRATAT
jgi:hypothetical protein